MNQLFDVIGSNGDSSILIARCESRTVAESTAARVQEHYDRIDVLPVIRVFQVTAGNQGIVTLSVSTYADLSEAKAALILAQQRYQWVHLTEQYI